MNYYDPASYRSPENKREVRQAATILIGLGGLFALGALLGLLMWFFDRDPQWLIFVFTLGGAALLLFAAGAYNVYYTRRMRHHSFVEIALGSPAITVFVIMALICAVVFGGIGLLIYFK